MDNSVNFVKHNSQLLLDQTDDRQNIVQNIFADLRNRLDNVNKIHTKLVGEEQRKKPTCIYSEPFYPMESWLEVKEEPIIANQCSFCSSISPSVEKQSDGDVLNVSENLSVIKVSRDAVDKDLIAVCGALKRVASLPVAVG